MKSKKEIKEEIAFQESEYDRHRKIADAQNDSECGKLKRQLELEVMSRHAARRQALLWVIGKSNA